MSCSPQKITDTSTSGHLFLDKFCPSGCHTNLNKEHLNVGEKHQSFRLFTRLVTNEERLKVSSLILPNTGACVGFLLPVSMAGPWFDFSSPDCGGSDNSFSSNRLSNFSC